VVFENDYTFILSETVGTVRMFIIEKNSTIMI